MVGLGWRCQFLRFRVDRSLDGWIDGRRMEIAPSVCSMRGVVDFGLNLERKRKRRFGGHRHIYVISLCSTYKYYACRNTENDDANTF